MNGHEILNKIRVTEILNEKPDCVPHDTEILRLLELTVERIIELENHINRIEFGGEA
jgi:hypothetical protein